ncbi:MAG: radical SAM protein [Pseudomonadota bacterium]
MSDVLKIGTTTLNLNREGTHEYTKISYPLRTGVYSEIELPDLVLQFNLNHEIIRAAGRGRTWLHPSEWLKRSRGNDWVYYSTGGYTGVFEATGEYYLPNLQYPTNALMGGKPFQEKAVSIILETWHDRILEVLDQHRTDLPDRFLHFLCQAAENSPSKLQEKADTLFSICGGRATVMPPDARHVDYDIIPLTVSRGCLYKCRFCRIKSDKPFSTLTEPEIKDQISRLKHLYGNDLANYNSVFLGEHDALNAPADVILKAVSQALFSFDFANANIRGSNVFMFGSVDSLLNAAPRLFEELDRMPLKTYINIGLESADQETLDRLGKPITSDQVHRAFYLIQEINQRFDRIEITANFIMDDNLPPGHYPAFLDLVRDSVPRPRTKGCVYLSPLRINNPSREVMFDFNRLKTLSRVPTFLYIIQRL